MKERTIRLFSKLGAIYGHLWMALVNDRSMGKYLAEVWENELEDIPNENIAFGLKKCIERFPKPPTLPEFKRLCFMDDRDIGLTRPSEAWIKKDKHYTAVMNKIPSWDRSHLPEKDLKRIFYDYYAEYSKKLVEEANKQKFKKLVSTHILEYTLLDD